MDYTIQTDKLVKKYKNRTVVNEVSINFTQGEIVGLLGPNGAGKTTSFYMIVGLIKPFSGRIFLNDRDISEEPMYKRAQMGIAYLPQEASVFRQMTVEENIRAILEFSGKSKAEQKEVLESLISDFNIEKVRHNKGNNLSGGERRRVEIARCLAIEPRFILLDEPFASQDKQNSDNIKALIQAQCRSGHCAFIVISHDSPYLEQFCNRVISL